MSSQIHVQYQEVYNKTEQLRQQIEAELREMENGYSQIQSSLDRLDSGTNARLQAAMERNRRKALIVAETLRKMSSFMTNSTNQIEQFEQKAVSIFAATAIKGGSK